MGSERYVVGTARDVISVDENTAAIISPTGRFCMKGAGIPAAVQNILEFFKEPAYFEDAVSALSGKYSAATLKKMLVFLADKGILVEEPESEAMRKHSDDFLEKSYYYTIGGKPLQKLIDDLASLRIGIIGTKQLTQLLLEDFSKGGLLTNFITSEMPDVHAIINESDFIIAAANYNDHYTFNKINELCFKQGKKWLRVMVEGISAEVGPLFVPGETCCYSCLHTRRHRNMSAEEIVFNDLFASEQFSNRENPLKFSSLYPLNIMAANIACAETMKFLTGMKCNLLNQVLTVDCLDMKTQIDYIYKNYLCSVCA